MYRKHEKFIWGFVAGTFLGGFVIRLFGGLVKKV
jgi:hypothetical protein